jgi:hypothetical protein
MSSDLVAQLRMLGINEKTAKFALEVSGTRRVQGTRTVDAGCAQVESDALLNPNIRSVMEMM